jgi:hypothetical protein
MRTGVKLACACLVLCAAAGLLSFATWGTSRDDIVADPEIAGPSLAEAGAWRTKTQQVFDRVERTLVRRMYTVWDPAPSRNLDFVWVADSRDDDKEGLVNGRGRLIWRIKGKPAYDPTSIFAEFRGSMKDGRPDGHGAYFDRSGLAYEGEWKNGVMEGQGTLKLASADQYTGQFRAGKANGTGRYVDVTGEVFEGQFVDGLREGRGTTTLPNGLIYRSTWSGGKETEGSRTVRLVQLGGQRAPGGADDVRLGITIDTTRAREGDLKYTASNIGPGLSIRPDNKRLMDLWKGGAEIQLTLGEESLPGQEYGVFSLSRGELFPLTLVLGVQNRSSMPLEVAGAYLDVQTSATDLQPAIQLRVGPSTECSEEPGYRPMFKLENFGWGAAERAMVRFAFSNTTARTGPAVFNLAKSVGHIDRSVTVDLEPELQAAGVDTGLLRRLTKAGLACKAQAHNRPSDSDLRSKDDQACLEELKASRVFGSLARHITLDYPDIIVGAVGTLEYDWIDGKGNQKNAASPFNAGLHLGHLVRENECGEGGPRDPISSRPIDFRLDQSRYRLPVAFQRSVPAGRTSRFTLPVRAAKSSEHDFRVVIQLADGREISSQPIHLLYYVPKWFPGS